MELERPKSKAEYDKAMGVILRKVINGDNLSNLDDWETDVAVTCSEKGYLSKPKYAKRTEDGKMHTEYAFPHVEHLGMEFLNSQKLGNRINWPIAMSLCAWLISLLSNLDKITETLQRLIEWIQSMQ